MEFCERFDWRTYQDKRDQLEERIRELEERQEELRDETAEQTQAGESWMALSELEAMAPQDMGNLREVLRALSRTRESLRALKTAYSRAAAGKTREVPGQLMLTAA